MPISSSKGFRPDRNTKDPLVVANRRIKDLEEALKMAIQAHHTTVAPSKIHAPAERDYRDCSAKICRKAADLLS